MVLSTRSQDPRFQILLRRQQRSYESKKIRILGLKKTKQKKQPPLHEMYLKPYNSTGIQLVYSVVLYA